MKREPNADESRKRQDTCRHPNMDKGNLGGKIVSYYCPDCDFEEERDFS